MLCGKGHPTPGPPAGLPKSKDSLPRGRLPSPPALCVNTLFLTSPKNEEHKQYHCIIHPTVFAETCDVGVGEVSLWTRAGSSTGRARNPRVCSPAPGRRPRAGAGTGRRRDRTPQDAVGGGRASAPQIFQGQGTPAGGSPPQRQHTQRLLEGAHRRTWSTRALCWWLAVLLDLVLSTSCLCTHHRSSWFSLKSSSVKCARHTEVKIRTTFNHTPQVAKSIPSA